MVQSVGTENKKQGVLPYALGGAAVGALGGWGLSNAGFTKAPKYDSWKAVLMDSKDILEKGSVEGASTEVKEATEAVKNAKATFNNSIKNLVEKSDDYKTLSQYAERNKANADYLNEFKRLVAEAEKGNLGFDTAGKTGEELTKAAKKQGIVYQNSFKKSPALIII